MNDAVVQEIEALLMNGQYSKAGLKLGKNAHDIDPKEFNRLNKRIKQLAKSQPSKKGTYAPVDSTRGKVFAHSAIHR